MLTDIEIAQAAQPLDISAVAEKAGVASEYLECYGRTKAKVDYNLLRDKDYQPGKLILVTAINPTPAGEGKTTTTVGLADALSKMGKNTVVALPAYSKTTKSPRSRCASLRSGPSLA